MPPESVSYTILIIDDDLSNLQALGKVLRREDYQVLEADNAADGLKILTENSVQLTITDLKMPGLDGMDLLKQIKTKQPEMEVIVVTAHGTIEKAVAAIKEGAYDFITKPLERHTILRQVSKALEKQKLLRENLALKRELMLFKSGGTLIGTSAPMQHLLTQIQQVAATDATVLLTGESGTGKELAAQALHRQSLRANRPLVTVSCTTIPENLLEAELFGYDKGAFTGAVARREGRFEIANGGTIFLDEIGDLPLTLQGKLLRILQDGAFERLGSNKTQKVDVRIIAATHRDLEQLVRAQRFREDLYFRLHGIAINLPPLRERREDLPLLAEHFMRIYGAKNGKQLHGISDAALQALMAHSWPGNVRELEKTIERAVIFSRQELLAVEDLPEFKAKLQSELTASPPSSIQMQSNQLIIPLGTPLQEIERQLIKATLNQTAGDKEKAAHILGIAARTIYRKLA